MVESRVPAAAVRSRASTGCGSASRSATVTGAAGRCGAGILKGTDELVGIMDRTPGPVTQPAPGGLGVRSRLRRLLMAG